MKKKKRIVSLSVLPGEPLDGSGKVCIHLFVQDEAGPSIEPHVLHPKIGEDGNAVKGQLDARPTRGRIACDPNKSLEPIVRRNVTIVTMRTDDVRAVSCPKCRLTKEYVDMVFKYTSKPQ